MGEPLRCVNCGQVIYRSGNDYKGSPRYVHSNSSIQCTLFAWPTEAARTASEQPQEQDR